MDADKISSLVWYLMWLMVFGASVVTWGLIWGYNRDRKEQARLKG